MSRSDLSPLPERSAHAVREATRAAALRLERGVCVGRIVLFTAILVRFFAVSDIPASGKALTALPIVLGIAFSVYVLLIVKRPPGAWLPWTSVAIDAVAVFFALVTNALFPTPEYPGLIRAPDTAAILLSTMGAGLRLSPTVAIFGGMLNFASVFALVSVDRIVSGDRFVTSMQNSSLFFLWVAGAAIIAYVLASTTRRLAIHGAVAAAKVEQAERGLWAMLAAHHDVGSMLTSARIDAEVLREGLAEAKADQAKRALRLERVVTDLCDMVAETKRRAVGSIAEQERLEAVSMAEVVRDATDRMLKRFPSVSIKWEVPEGESVLVAGGRRAILRMMLNMLENACEGSGEQSATRVEVLGWREARSNRVTILVRDDGPGLADTPETLRSTKAGGTGVGLLVVKGIAEASGGSFRIGNRKEGGCEAVLVLPGA